ncbi:GntR family transcriptional regulator [Xanthobacter sp. V0B-10]|uniref:GntR family transcriptional regulator n=1 Tax=Xanthobacter albus TaxID=3119929 RepID=UPI00372C0DE2
MSAPRSRPGRNRGNLADEVSQCIADEIVIGQLEPGTRLDEVSLAERYQVSRTPIREALKKLSSMGLVETRPNRGSIVTSLSITQLDMAFEAIGELEAACARHAAVRMSADELKELAAIHDANRAALQAGDIDQYDEANRAFHNSILQGCHNSILIEQITSLHNRVAPFRRSQFRNLERMGASFEEHCAIVDAILKHDGSTAYREMRAHLLAARNAATLTSAAWTAPVPGKMNASAW